MTNDELKKKIMDIVRGAMIEANSLPFLEETDAISDELIAAGIGDVKEAEHRAEIAEKALSSLVHEMYEHDIRPMCDEKFFIESRLKEAEKELAEERKDD